MLANSTRRGSHVRDPFGGSGSTLIACEALGLTAYLVELDDQHVDVIVARWENLTGKHATRVSALTFSEVRRKRNKRSKSDCRSVASLPSLCSQPTQASESVEPPLRTQAAGFIEQRRVDFRPCQIHEPRVVENSQHLLAFFRHECSRRRWQWLYREEGRR